jgi:hypothetical protein
LAPQSPVPLTKNTVDAVLELSSALGQLDLVADVFENYRRLTNGKRKDLMVYEKLLQAVTSTQHQL